MTTPRIVGVELSGDAALPLLLVGPSLGTSATTLWSPVAAELARDFHVVGWNLPGHDGAPVGDTFTMAELAEGVLAFAGGVCAARGDAEVGFAYAGDSVGGAVGLQIALDSPDTLRSAVLLCTGARIGEESMWRERAATVRESGTPTMVSGSAQRWFAEGFLEREPAAGAALLHVLQAADAEGYAQVCEALAAFDVRDRLAEISVPVLAVAGAHDVATPPADLEEIAEGVPDGRLLVLADAAHLAPIECPAEVASAIRRVAAGSVAPETARTLRIGDEAEAEDAYERGMAVRRAVLGDAHVDRATARADDLTRPFQELITRYAWGEVWGRDVLDRRARSMITLALLAALGHDDELAMHVRAALRNGVSREEIAEVFLHTGVYAGVPVANSALSLMQRVLADGDPGS
ncbi:4-carboxymuconolactone decarboxylase [Mumia zhuanghuii]|uniref:4-carboxymuconolactone decarboxylase n=1 Tax=Mumia zhuanghuii TaxID=2585211 RepID=A0A5C4MPC2_9ACTN|nr:4-carboxymuconolactone decarboxylase [Mumia zhuanghuii]TNC33965.1 4-carboxymuconolactone decarboxylase [Mumia zhuanghuii]TNC47447.1 4-carboxymuconolactone decarboxylase [Mumia zhuanghuii]